MKIYLYYILFSIPAIFFMNAYFGKTRPEIHTYVILDKIVENSVFGSSYGVVIQEKETGHIFVRQGIHEYYTYPNKGYSWKFTTKEATLEGVVSGLLMLVFSIYTVVIIKLLLYFQG